MNTRILAALFLVVASVTGAQAQTELPNQWVDQQIKAAKQEHGEAARLAAAARNSTAATNLAAPKVASQNTSVLHQESARAAVPGAADRIAAQK